MAVLGAFERQPTLGVAVSGGPDSLSLVLLADRWARSRGGFVHAITIDHAIRPDSAAEAEKVAQWMAARGISHETHRLQEALPAADLQGQARAARYRALERICAERSILHLLTGHHREDQAETFMLRLARGSGVDGLAAMAGVTPRRHIRLLRPLLDTPRARLAATCTAMSQASVDDPSNRNPAFARVKLRQGWGVLDAGGLSADRLAQTAQHLGRARAALEDDTAALLARVARYHEAGFVRVDPKGLGRASPEIGLRALVRVLQLVGGQYYKPRFERTERLYAELQRALDRTLGGCRLVSEAAGTVLIYREPAAIAPDQPLGREAVRWDGRFTATAAPHAWDGLSIGALGIAGAAFMRTSLRLRPDHAIPPRVRPTLPCIRRLDEIQAVPHLNYYRSDAMTDPTPMVVVVSDPDNA
jgi:tRNA(Ile)-lysidine synthase